MMCSCGREVVVGSPVVKRVSLEALGTTMWTAEAGLVDGIVEQIAAAGVEPTAELRCLECAREAVERSAGGYRMPGVGLWSASPEGLVLLHESAIAAVAGARP